MNGLAGSACPLPAGNLNDRITLAHGEGARLTRELLQQRILPRLGADAAAALDDAAVLPALPGRLAFSTDSYVVSPLFFPGGDIGKLAVMGTANDLAVAGSRPMWLSLSLIIEEGLAYSDLDRILASIAQAATEARMRIATGDTKVVPKGAADGLFINTSGIGLFQSDPPPGPDALQPGDQLIVSGPIGGHGMAVLTAREALDACGSVVSDCAQLWPAIEALRNASVPVTSMRDATRGGLAAVLHEWAIACGHTLAIDEASIPVSPAVRGYSELLGLDPVFVANEGTMLIAVPASQAERALDALRRTEVAAHARLIGHVAERGFSPVTVRRALGRDMPLDEPSGAFLPRIC
ncbi:MAG: hydrogenase expression/formation protein HypE [Aureliella sp.]